ncbi:magnesium chelatase [Streptomyces sp. MB09-02B]|uniref:magnesium chelatase n=1 Tax=Streptomyces sp. MB09-02B TaxID=3028667 RepID=UPI0029B0AA5F|nr:magnesium chelatase [Streptomyces sp. MB09-02B]MDX3642919.1 magnesium chelatase [Streptomyces sp. MB09-02B]
MPTEPPDAEAHTTPTAPGATEHSQDLTARLCKALVCAAIDPALSSVLLFDLEPQLLDPVARLCGRVLGGAHEQPPPIVMLGATSRDEDLWIRLVLRQESDGITFRLAPGPLIEADGRPGPPPVVAVPDLQRLSVAGMRGAVQLLGADVAVVEHAGLRHAARPRARWLAACRSVDAGRISGHLLDRFAIRLPAADMRPFDIETALDSLPSAWLDMAARAADGIGVPPITVTDAAITRTALLLGPDAGIRRELALLRLARALAVLEDERVADTEHCEKAARLMGLAVTEAHRAVRREPDGEPSRNLASRPGPRPRGDAQDRRGADPADPRVVDPGQGLLEPEPPEGVGSAPGGFATVLATPYPEDEADVQRDLAPLRSPWQGTTGRASPRGVVIGTRRARDLSDLAYVRTVREAAVHQRIRGTDRFTVSPVDLRSYVRAGAPERMLVLLLDHTCRKDWDWQDALIPFLHWAYTVRAAVYVVEVGSAETADELKAESFASRSVLHPKILAALYRPPGRASPLAHGVEQAARALRRAFQQHGSGLVQASLVVVTDGRGNVPLRVSHTGRLTGPVGAEGVTDALRAAADVRAMDRTRLRVFVLDAGTQPYGDLPFSLADSLGAAVVDGRAHSAPESDASQGGGTGEWW